MDAERTVPGGAGRRAECGRAVVSGVSDGERSGAFDHLFTETVREGLGEEGYGSWRSIDAPGAVSLSFGFPYPESFPEEELVAAARAVFDEEGEDALQYGGGDYVDRLVESIVDQERRQGIDCEPATVLLTNGATHAIDVVCHTFLEHGDEVFVDESLCRAR